MENQAPKGEEETRGLRTQDGDASSFLGHSEPLGACLQNRLAQVAEKFSADSARVLVLSLACYATLAISPSFQETLQDRLDH